MLHYTYKITFEETQHFYYGVRSFQGGGRDCYMGSPKTHKWMWSFYTPQKQILQFFDSRELAADVERRLILPELNNPLCLNERCGRVTSIETCKKAGRASGAKHKKNKTGVCGRSAEEMSEHGRRGVESRRRLGIGFNDKNLQSKLGRRGGKALSKIRYACVHPAYPLHVSTAGGLAKWMKSRAIDKSFRVKVPKRLTDEEWLHPALSKYFLLNLPPSFCSLMLL